MVIAHNENGKKMIRRCHESCKNHTRNIKFDGLGTVVYDRCEKGHILDKWICEICEDYQLTDEPWAWKLPVD